MIKFLKKFFKLGQDPIYDEIENPKEPNEINTSPLYKQLRKYSFNNNINDINYLVLVYFNDFYSKVTDILEYSDSNDAHKFINGCKEQALIDGDLILFRELFLSQRITGSAGLTYDDILDYGYKALELNKKDIFEYLISFHHSEYSECASFNYDVKVMNIIDHIIDNNKIEYFDILKEYQLTEFTPYITSKLENYNSFSSKENIAKNIERITFVLDKFSESINNQKLCSFLHRATTYQKKVFPPEVMELFDNFEFVKKRNESKKLLDELTEELKPSIEVKKPKKLKV